MVDPKIMLKLVYRNPLYGTVYDKIEPIFTQVPFIVSPPLNNYFIFDLGIFFNAGESKISGGANHETTGSAGQMARMLKHGTTKLDEDLKISSLKFKIHQDFLILRYILRYSLRINNTLFGIIWKVNDDGVWSDSFLNLVPDLGTLNDFYFAGQLKKLEFENNGFYDDVSLEFEGSLIE